MNHRRAGTGMERGLPTDRARGTLTVMEGGIPAGKARGWPAGRTFGLLAGAVLLICAAFIDPPSVYRTDTETQVLSPREFGMVGASWTAWTAWPRTAAFVPGVAWADHADYAFPPQRGDDQGKSITIEAFDDSAPGGFPLTWKAWRGNDDQARSLYTIREEKGNRYLHAADDGTSIIILKPVSEWDANKYPVLSWRWRATVLPEGGDERIRTKNDSSVAVYVVLDQNFIGVPKTLKYVWSTTAPVGTHYRREGIGRPHVIVLESGKEKLGQWVEESVDVHADYVRIFGKKPPRKAVGIGILTDGNATGSDSRGDYDDFVVHRRDTGS
ncbi:MAG: DUF3047 domain-containing protein [Gemmatimonadetes bacterium]|nr:DUF3047 domain-containing protein [Gemmatimonadota bacterium]